MAKDSCISYVMTSLIFVELTKEDNLKDGMYKALSVISYYLDADSVSVFREFDNEYKTILKFDQPETDVDQKQLEEELNKDKDFLQEKEYKLIPYIKDSPLSNSYFYKIKYDGKNYILGVKNIKNRRDNIGKYLVKLKVIFPLITKTCIEQEKKEFEDGLTHLGNRTKFNKKLEVIDTKDKSYIMGIFDLFRLKHINDNFSHRDGDEYIINGANILRETFGVIPKTSIYRIGGDEFVVVAEGDDVELFRTCADMCSEKTKKLAFAKIHKVPLDMNYGIHLREGLESGKEMYFKSDKVLQDQKTEVYKSLGLDRRR